MCSYTSTISNQNEKPMPFKLFMAICTCFFSKDFNSGFNIENRFERNTRLIEELKD